MSKSLLDFNIYENNTLEPNGTVIVEFVAREGDASTWETTLEELAKSGKRTVFRINYIDNNGIVVILIRHWLRYAPNNTILVDSSVPAIRTMLKLMFEEKITFTDNMD